MLVFIDESGDPGISSNLRYFVIAVLIFDDPRQALLMQRQITHLLSTFGKSEFKFSKSKAAERDTFFYEIDKFDFRVGAIIVDKNLIGSATLRSDPRKFYNYFLKQLLVSSEVVEARVRLDGKADKRLRNAMVNYLNARGTGIVKNFQMKDSKSDPLIQAADMIVGAIARSCYSHKHNHLRWKKQLGSKIFNIWWFK